jgi:hypothetical protein
MGNFMYMRFCIMYSVLYIVSIKMLKIPCLDSPIPPLSTSL